MKIKVGEKYSLNKQDLVNKGNREKDIKDWKCATILSPVSAHGYYYCDIHFKSHTGMLRYYLKESSLMIDSTSEIILFI